MLHPSTLASSGSLSARGYASPVSHFATVDLSMSNASAISCYSKDALIRHFFILIIMKLWNFVTFIEL